ncbi:MAG: WecB/TagA/CpsF family glycosyltransferase [Ignavibacteriaceae bacterium]|nr:WecB/TagA/CpsF family glycosyltransferase [Ignavibacteriaceae bacterium]
MDFKLNDIAIYDGTINSIRNNLMDLISGNFINQIITLNLDFLRISTLDEEFKKICMDAALVVPDGVGVTSLLGRKYRKHFQRITGNDLLIELLNLSNTRQLRYAFVGASKEVQRKMSEKIKRDYPLIENTLFISPENNFEQDNQKNNLIIEKLTLFNPDILIVALGCPRQEKWIFNNKDKIKAKINIGVGAAFDFYSGIIKRAPLLIQKVKFEWLWRMLIEPKRLLKRYIIDDMPFYILTLTNLIFRQKKI